MGETCGGCKFHSFPYKARLPILINGKRQTKTFNCKEDVWNVVDLLIKEVKEMNTKGKEFDVSESINAQLPFFSCRNNVFDRDIQKDIQKYLQKVYKRYTKRCATYIQKYVETLPKICLWRGGSTAVIHSIHNYQ